MTAPTANTMTLSSGLEALAALGLGVCISSLIWRRTELRFNAIALALLISLGAVFSVQILTVCARLFSLRWDLSALTMAGALSWTLFALMMMLAMPSTLRVPTRRSLLRIRKAAEERVREVSRQHLERETLLRHEANRDALTGILRRGPIMRRLEDACRDRGPGNVAVIMVDLDDFKKVNDTYGHRAGDEVLSAAAGALSEVLRDCDHVGRYGGEEFLAILPGPSAASSQEIAERIRAAVESRVVVFDEKPIRVTCSIGVAVFGRDEAPTETLDRADRALYVSKRGDKNCVTFLPVSGKEDSPSMTIRAKAPSVSPPAAQLLMKPSTVPLER